MHIDRLTQLAEHLEKGTVHKEFSLKYFNRNSTETNKCGTVGCALGECPFIFEGWDFAHTGWLHQQHDGVVWVEDDFRTHENFEAAKRFFGITLEECDLLFLGGENHVGTDYTMDGEDKVWHFEKYKVGKETMEPLSEQTATAREVAAQIRKFIQLKTAVA